ncbi:MAG: twin-arginine translocase TatA/TatE family subunit [Candidatus Kapabacteria bacterium]|nr:twin-arginine translocase TatA/TatE family subunit [Candidatus Kapabacteria bacterium]MDW8011566.1 twin-arginine translocase TatA/TatE family subunit [Bacteroidota bacterium]
MFGLGPTELLLIALVLLLLFGGRKIPELMRGLGSGIREFKRAASLEEEGSQGKSASSAQQSPSSSLPS